MTGAMPTLTRKQREALIRTALAAGRTPAQIAYDLVLPLRTGKRDIRRIAAATDTK